MPQSSNLQELIDRCVMCGLCSQHCPTYALTQDENESPRGRIALISAANRGQITLETQAKSHLEHCVSCRACENFCPSGVRFGAIMDEGRALMATEQGVTDSQPALSRHILTAVSHPQRLERMGSWLSRYQRWGLQKLARGSGVLKALGLAEAEKLLPTIPSLGQPMPPYSPANGEYRGDVALFTGCITRLVDHQTLDDSRRLLNRLGYGVHIPTGQTCCGALHRHSGDATTAQQLARTNLTAFESLDIKAILHTATGCTAQLQEYRDYLTGDDAHNSANFSGQVQDINQFLVRIMDEGHWPQDLRPRPLAQTVLVHESCSLRNVLHQADKPSRLLAMIPDSKLIRLPESLGCCGAGGSYMLSQADFSHRMREKTLEAINRAQNDAEAIILVSANIGCALHLAAGLREQDKVVNVMHPVSLLVRQLNMAEA